MATHYRLTHTRRPIHRCFTHTVSWVRVTGHVLIYVQK